MRPLRSRKGRRRGHGVALAGLVRGIPHLNVLITHKLLGGAALPLTLLTQRTRAATTNAGPIHDAQAAIGFSTPLLGRQRLPCWTAERPVGLKRKVLARKAPRFPGGGYGGSYPDAGTDEAAACSLGGGMAGA